MNDSPITSVAFEHAAPLADMSVAQIAALPPAQLQEAHINLLTLQSAIKGVLERFSAALDQRYAEQAVAARQANGRDFGVCHLSDGPLRITVDVPKRVSWDQVQLAEIAQRIAVAGDKVSDYIDTDYSVSESRFNAWPSTLKETFAKARTVKPGKASYRLALAQENQE
jgi:nucleotide-binding universal stress UspA family protein